MPEKVHQSLQGVSETLLMTLYARARESQRPNPHFRDEKAVTMVAQIDCDFSHLQMQRHDEIFLVMRIGKIDQWVGDFLRHNPDPVVVHIGCGLDTRFERVDNGQVEWFDLDLPEVIALRQALLPGESSPYHILAASAFDDDWLSALLPYRPRPFLFVAEGVLPYFAETQVRSLFCKLRETFPGCELVFDAHSPFSTRLNNLHLSFGKVKARLHWSLKDAREIEGWGEGIRLLDEWYYFEDKDSPAESLRWMRWVPGLARTSGIFHYRLGNPQPVQP